MDMPDPLRLIHEMLWRQLCPQCDALGPHALAPDDRMDALARLVCIDCGTFLSWIDFAEARHADAVWAACGLPSLSILGDRECCFAGAGSAPAWRRWPPAHPAVRLTVTPGSQQQRHQTSGCASYGRSGVA